MEGSEDAKVPVNYDAALVYLEKVSKDGDFDV
jgi:hypothetical protein